jgi:hypothetical protein
MGTYIRAAIGLALVLLGHAADGLANYIQAENAKPGTTEWKITSPGYASGAIEGYASLTSVNRGGQIQLFVNTADPSYTMDHHIPGLQRLGRQIVVRDHRQSYGYREQSDEGVVRPALLRGGIVRRRAFFRLWSDQPRSRASDDPMARARRLCRAIRRSDPLSIEELLLRETSGPMAASARTENTTGIVPELMAADFPSERFPLVPVPA